MGRTLRRRMVSSNIKRKDYDLIVVGAGSAGCVIASKISENAGTRVLLIEAGPLITDPLIDNPKDWFQLTGSDYVWDDKSTSQRNADGREFKTGHGKLVGGSGAINAMIHHRPSRDDIDIWALRGWGFDDIFPSFKSSETWLGTSSSERGTSGPIKVMPLPDPPELAQSALSAAERLGYGINEDLNGSQSLGASLNQLAFDGSNRQHAGFSYLKNALPRPNLELKTDSHVVKLIIEQEECVGINFIENGSRQSAFSGAVILCAGALRTPVLLMHSGVGPAENLMKLSIPVHVDAGQVGLNLHDHVLISGHNFATEEPVRQSKLHDTVAIVYASSQDNNTRDIMLNISTNSLVIPPLESSENGFKSSFSYTKPKSRGALSLVSKDPSVKSKIDHNLFSDPRDMSGALRALDISREILNASEFKSFSGTELNPNFLNTAENKKRLILSGATSFGHYSGTCRMGTDVSSVVDEDLSVRGVENLYIMDASVLPEIPSSPTNALVIAMAELAAQRLIGKL